MTYDELIYNTATGDGMPSTLAVMIVAQARHETGNYTSHFFTQGKNAFGYSYYPGSKWQLPTPGGIADNNAATAQYSSIQNSVHEITDWIKRRQKEGNFPQDLRTIQTPDQYAKLLKNAGYFGAPLDEYANALIAWLQQISTTSLASNGDFILLIVAIGLIAYRTKLFGRNKPSL